MATRRTKRLANLIQAELAELLSSRVRDPRVKGVTITGVDVAPDLSHAKVFYSLLDEARQDEAQAGLKAAAPYLRREMARRLHLKKIPQVVPVFDPSLAGGVAMDALINKVRAEDERAAELRGDSGEDES
jgi:ribosome-binding factor A